MKKRDKDFHSFIKSRQNFVKTYGVEIYNPFDQISGWDAIPTIGFKISNSSKSYGVKHVQVGDQKLLINNCFKDLIEELELSSELLTYEDGWDGSGSKKLDNALLIFTAKFLIEYFSFLHDKYSIIIQTPEINLCPNGSLDLSWATENARLLINFKSSDTKVLGRFYNYLLISNGTEIVKVDKEGSIDLNSFDESLAVWMKNLS
jgi:hypothetical protein